MTTLAPGRDQRGDEVGRLRLKRPSGAAEQVDSIVRLVVVKARADGFGPDDWRIMEALHQWAVRLPHEVRLWWISELSRRTDDLQVGVDVARPPVETGTAR